MIIGSISEDKNIEKRVAITPDVVKKYIALGLKVHLVKNYSTHLGITDKEYDEEQFAGEAFPDNDLLANGQNSELSAKE